MLTYPNTIFKYKTSLYYTLNKQKKTSAQFLWGVEIELILINLT